MEEAPSKGLSAGYTRLIESKAWYKLSMHEQELPKTHLATVLMRDTKDTKSNKQNMNLKTEPWLECH